MRATAEMAASDAAYHASRPYRFIAAVNLVLRHQRAHLYPVLHCPREHMLPTPERELEHQYMAAARPGRSPEDVGTLCEPWLTRGALTMLDQLLEPHHRGLEWSSGSSTVWLLLRLASLHTVEHDAAWLKSVRQHIGRRYDAETASHWTFHHSPCVELRRGACQGWAHSSTGNNYTDYVEYPRRHFLPTFRGGWDIVLIDGRSRAECILETLRTPGFFNRKGHGLLVLDNAERARYDSATKQVPSTWLRVCFAYKTAATAVWMACDESEHCARAHSALAELQLLRKGADCRVNFVG